MNLCLQISTQLHQLIIRIVVVFNIYRYSAFCVVCVMLGIVVRYGKGLAFFLFIPPGA